MINGRPYGIFKTGDKFVKHQDKLYFLGRTSDLQDIKINGQKVNVTGINNVIRSHPHIKDCAVILKHKPKSKKPYLAVYISANKNSDITIMQLRKWCKKHLSNYEIPTHFIFLNQLPQTDNGKTDLNKLKKSPILLTRSKRTPVYLPSRSTIENTVCNITKNTIEFPGDISLADPIEFISPNSIDFMTLITNIEENFDIEDLSDELLKTKNPTVKNLSESVYKLLALKNSRSIIKQVKTGNKKLEPIIIVHPITPESVNLYREFYSNLKTDREIYVINAPIWVLLSNNVTH
ncbi:MAG: amino acid adenylation domain-containing protein [Gammaproteobacteria bacterium]|nr:amino acid adenylation domain-containing protein [Gammaproteobacteria bacterium]